MFTVEFGTTLIFLTSAAIAVYTSNSAFGTSSPIALLIVTALVVFSIARGFTIMFSMATKSFMLNFLEDGERNGSDEEAYTEEVPYVAGGKIEHPRKPKTQKKMFMPKKLQDLIEKFSYLLDDRPPSSGEAVHDMIQHKLSDLTLVHSNSHCRLMRRTHVAQTSDPLYDSGNLGELVRQYPGMSSSLLVPLNYLSMSLQKQLVGAVCSELEGYEKFPGYRRIKEKAGPYTFEYDVENIKDFIHICPLSSNVNRKFHALV